MGTIADKLNYLNATKTAIKNAIISKGGSVADTDTFRSYAEKINSLSTGGSSTGGSDELARQLIERLVTSIEIPNGVTKIGDNAFYSYKTLTSITIPSSVTTLGGDSFSLCNNLTSITLPNSVTSIGNSCFSSCSKLENVVLSENLDSIGSGAFSFTKLTDLIIPNSVTSINTTAFSYCSSLEKIWILSTCTTINTTSSYSSPFQSSNPSCVIYTDATSKSDGWGTYWNYYNSTEQLQVVWGATKEQYEAA